MVEVGVARVVERLETASGRVGRVGLDHAGRRTDPPIPRPIPSHGIWRLCPLKCAISWGTRTIMTRKYAPCAR